MSDKSNIMEDIRDSSTYEQIFDDLKDKYENATVEEGTYYVLNSAPFDKNLYTVVVKVMVDNKDCMDLLFYIDDNNEIIQSEVDVDIMSGPGKSQEIDEFVEEEKTLKDKVRDIKC